MRITLLGTGTSSGIPVIGCDCAVCTSDDPRNKRLRCSALVETGAGAVLIDTSPDLRIQALRYGIKRIDAVLYTHAHADHIHGIDELRAFNLWGGNPIACYANAETLKRIRCYFDYIFHQEDAESFRPQLVPSEISGPFELGGVEVVPVPLMHGRMQVLGYRLGDFAYCTDTSGIPESSLPLLENLEVLVLDALRHKPHPTHFSIDQAVDAARRIGARHTFFVHMSHYVDHEPVQRQLPPGIELAYDGLQIEI